MSNPYANPAKFPAAPSGGAKSNVVLIVLIILAVMLVLAVCVIGMLFMLLMPAISQARVAAQRAMVQNSARQISMALLNYEMTNRELPAAQTTGDGSEPLLSWRVQILPFLEEAPIYERLQRNKAWDDPANVALTNETVMAFTSPRCPDTEGTNRTAFVAVVDTDTVLRVDGPRKMREIADGVSNTAMLLELRESDIAWAEPRDVNIDEAVRLIQSCSDPGGLTVALADGSVKNILPSTSEDDIRKLFNCSDGAAISW